MGTALWLACGFVAFFLARIVPFRQYGRVAEGVTAVVAASIGGLTATALDFGGWNEPDWRAVLFAVSVGFGAVALLRLVPLRRGPLDR